MLISYNWIKSYFKDSIPESKELADIITMGAFEIDGMEEKEVEGVKDTIFDIKILPDRSPYALSHRYVAQEIGALINQRISVPYIESVEVSESVPQVTLENEAGNTQADLPFCTRYVSRLIQGVTIGDSPAWLKNQLEILGQRSINAVVDLTNYILLETGQPLHVFDADKVEGAIYIRLAKNGEEITLLDGSTRTLTDSVLVIADDSGPLAIAGIKGGKKAEVTRDTKNVILEAACFNSTAVRKTSSFVGIKNDSSKRFENGVTEERAGLAFSLLSAKIKELNPSAQFGVVTDYYPNPIGRKSLSVSVSYINQRLGISVSKDTIVELLSRIDVLVSNDESNDDILILSIPEYRKDLHIQEDIIEEVGRLNGYDKIVGVVPQAEGKRRINKNFYYHTLIRKTLVGLGFSEVYTYTLTNTGDTKLANPLSADRAYLRDSLNTLIAEKTLFNLKNKDLIGVPDIRIFEIGKVFGGGVLSERYSLAYSIGRTKQPKGHDPKIELEAITAYILEVLGAHSIAESNKESGKEYWKERFSKTYTELKGDAQTPCTGFVVEFDLDALIEQLPDVSEDLEMPKLPEVSFKSISPYPFSVRDIAVFVPGEKGQEGMLREHIAGALKKNGKENLLVKETLFDVFTKNKEGEPVKTSYAFRLIFQSHEKTLGEEEISQCMQAVTEAFATAGFEVR